MYDKHWLQSVSIKADAWLSIPIAVDLQVTMNGQQFVSQHNGYTYDNPPIVSSFSPSSGPTHGNTHVQVYGNNFANGLNYTCKYGHMVVMATNVDQQHIRCYSPNMHNHTQSAQVPLEVSVNHIQSTKQNVHSFNFSTSQVLYTWYTVDSIDALSPTGGPTSGGSNVKLFGGSSFVGVGTDYRCKFGDMIVFASYHSSKGNTVSCVAPSNQEGSSNVRVTFNGQQYSREGFPFAYHIPQ